MVERKMMRGICLAVLLVLSACNTVAGIGEDVTAGARVVQKAF
jgi:predicted small secreted protein